MVLLTENKAMHVKKKMLHMIFFYFYFLHMLADIFWMVLIF